MAAGTVTARPAANIRICLAHAFIQHGQCVNHLIEIIGLDDRGDAARVSGYVFSLRHPAVTGPN